MFQEYVKPPVQIIIKPLPRAHPIPTRSMQATVTDIVPDVVQIDQLYAVQARNDDGFVIVKCLSVNPNDFNGVLLQKYSDDSSVLFYKESTEPPRA